MNEPGQTKGVTAPARPAGRLLERHHRLVVAVVALALLPVWVAVAQAGTEPSPVDPQWFVDETKLPFDPLPGPEGAAAQRSWGVLDGAGYRIEVPSNWNGELVMWAHGFAGWGAELSVANPPFRQWLVTHGYAWAASSYAKNGYVITQGVEDTHKLAQYFTANVGTPSRVYVTGASMGGHITAVSLERHAGSYAGALPVCGVLGDTELFDFFLDVNLGAEAVTGITAPFPFPDNWQSDIVPQIKAALAGDPGRVADFANLVKYLSGGDRPFFDVALANWTDFLFALAQPNPQARAAEADNLDRVYQLDADPGLSTDEETLNNVIPRVARRDHPAPERYGDAPRVNANFRVPVLTMHTIGDLFVPFSMEQIYARRAQLNGNDDLLVQRAIRDVGHCTFSPAEWDQAIADLTAWVHGGPGAKPAGDDVLTPSVIADPAYGCRFTQGERSVIPACPETS